jgi:hypothetical protein
MINNPFMTKSKVCLEDVRIKYSFEQKTKNSLTNEENNTACVTDLKDEHHYIYEKEEDKPPV